MDICGKEGLQREHVFWKQTMGRGNANLEREIPRPFGIYDALNKRCG